MPVYPLSRRYPFSVHQRVSQTPLAGATVNCALPNDELRESIRGSIEVLGTPILGRPGFAAAKDLDLSDQTLAKLRAAKELNLPVVSGGAPAQITVRCHHSIS